MTNSVQCLLSASTTFLVSFQGESFYIVTIVSGMPFKIHLHEFMKAKGVSLMFNFSLCSKSENCLQIELRPHGVALTR